LDCFCVSYYVSYALNKSTLLFPFAEDVLSALMPVVCKLLYQLTLHAVGPAACKHAHTPCTIHREPRFCLCVSVCVYVLCVCVLCVCMCMCVCLWLVCAL
jgi:hypothetical protein